MHVQCATGHLHAWPRVRAPHMHAHIHAAHARPHARTRMHARACPQVHLLLEDYQSAIDVYGEALQHSPENSEILTTLGILYLR